MSTSSNDEGGSYISFFSMTDHLINVTTYGGTGKYIETSTWQNDQVLKVGPMFCGVVRRTN